VQMIKPVRKKKNFVSEVYRVALSAKREQMRSKQDVIFTQLLFRRQLYFKQFYRHGLMSACLGPAISSLNSPES